jgi:isoleucyl-tRNA synthetase
MSKSLRNYPDVSEVFERDGADAMRWFLMSSSVIRGGNLVVTEEGIRESVRQFMLPLWSTYYFFTLYAGDAETVRRTDSSNVLDRYLLAKTRQLIEGVTTDLDELDSPMAAAKLRDFADVLTNWYVRRSRERFWDGTDRDAVDTLYTVLETLCRVAAPLAPLVTEEIWRGLTGGESVHLTDWPDASEFPADDQLVSAMDRLREVASAGLALRKAQGLRVRLPLANLTVVVADGSTIAEFTEILRDELNVKSVTVTELRDESVGDYGITRRLSVNSRTLGPRIGGQVQQVIAATKAGDWSVVDGVVTAGGIALVEGEYDLVLDVADTAVAVSFLGTGGFVVLDTVVTPELEAEGLARDVVRAVQQARKDAGLDVSDRIRLEIEGDGIAVLAIREHQDLIASETLAVEMELIDGHGGNVEVGSGSSIRVGVLKV